MKKIYLLFIALLVFILFVILVFYNIYARSYTQEKINDYISKNVEILNENLDTEKRYALSLSLLISQNPILKEALKKNSQKVALLKIKNILKNIKKSTHTDNIDIQVHTKDLRAFARSWDKSNYFGVKLGSFRKGLVIVKKSKEPFVSIELGKRLNIKAISPILDKNGIFLGSIEVIMDFSNIKKRLKKFNLKMIILLDKKFIHIAVDLKNHKKIDKYYIIGKKFDKKLYTNLVKNLYIFQRKKPYYILGKNIITVLPMKSVGIQDVGFIVLCMSAKQNNPYSSYTAQEINQENSIYRFNKAKKRDVIIR
ncbi:MAG: cache domain-containing protein [Campylobacteraceae bacterium]|nr:cache domain-containing protein [Campylobacteraceae bacterium]